MLDTDQDAVKGERQLLAEDERGQSLVSAAIGQAREGFDLGLLMMHTRRSCERCAYLMPLSLHSL